MCLVALAIDQHPRFPLVIASNRDEFFDRPTAALDWWAPAPGAPEVLSGRDLQSGGTWLGLTTAGRIALLTNVRGGRVHEAEAPSRGQIVLDWLAAHESSADFWTRIVLSGHNGFNLIAADFRRGECFWASNVDGRTQRLGPGLYGLSNAGLDTPWPKVTALKSELRAALDAADTADALAERLFAALGDRSVATDAALPRTGIPLVWERQLSAAFIRTPEGRYGTRCSTLVVTEQVDDAAVTQVFERSFDANGALSSSKGFALRPWPTRDGDGGLVEVVDTTLRLAAAPARLSGA